MILTKIISATHGWPIKALTPVSTLNNFKLKEKSVSINGGQNQYGGSKHWQRRLRGVRGVTSSPRRGGAGGGVRGVGVGGGEYALGGRSFP